MSRLALHAFDAALAGVERSDDETGAAVSRFATLAPPLLEAAAPAGSHSLWEFAAEWTPEADPPISEPAPPSAPQPSARAQDVAAEIGLGKLKSRADISRARRRFMWDNHPDRRTDLDRDVAHRRVAIANMLLDRALAALRRRGVR